MVGRDCWWRKGGGCSFCAWTTLYPNFRVRRADLLVDEIGQLIEKYHVKEIFDDTGTFPVGKWLKNFCMMMIERGYNEKIHFSCNMRFGALDLEDYKIMKKAGFRMLLFGLESASQTTLNRLNKGITVDDITRGCRMARQAGLEPHVTIMVGYPWEAREDVNRTLKLAKSLMEKSLAITLQSTIVMPYPGTKLYEEGIANGWFRIDPTDYSRFDMTEPVLMTPMEPKTIIDLCDDVYKIFLSPRYMLKHMVKIRSWEDLKYTIKGMIKVFGHVKDFAS